MTKKQEEAKLKKKQETKELHELFQRLWDNMPKEKNCHSCGAPIWGENKSYYWDHLLERNKYPELSLMEWNIGFVCGDCHSKKTLGYPTIGHSKMIERAQQHFKIWKEGLKIYENLLK